MKAFALAAIAGAAVAHTELEFEFMQYVAKFGKTYANIEEFEARLATFAEKHAFIQEHDAAATGYTLAHNQFSDWTQAEYEAMLTYQPMGETAAEAEETYEQNLGATPKDWRTSNCLNAIKDQGQCGSCWAFSGIATTENYWCTSNGKLYSLSEQQQVDCNTGCYGCNGGWAYKVWTYLERKYAETESAYPYTARDGTCKYSSSAATSVTTSGYSNVKSRSPSSMQTQLQSGILSVAIQANQLAFQLYSSGIFTNTNCGTNLDHATNVVGWGTSGDMDYWIMRNSWGTSWGDKGYMMLQIVSGAGLCGIQLEPNYAII